MSCNELKELILEYTVGNLDQDDKLRVESHLGECKDCNRFFRQSNEVWDLLDEWDVIEPKRDLVTNFWRSVSEEDSKGIRISDFFKSFRLGWSRAIALAVILIISVISFNIFEPEQTRVVFTESDKADEELLIELDRAVSRETARGLSIYGPWEDEIEKNDKGG
jgi:predicted anti-sigma-YlaC factor YlaD